MDEWEAYYELEPFGPPAINWNFARLLAVLMNAFRGKKSRVAKIMEVVLGHFPSPKKQSVEEMREKMIAISNINRKEK